VNVIVVVESCWGMEPLRRSGRLIKGMKGVALSSVFIYGFFPVILTWNYFFAKRGAYTESWVAAVLNWVVTLTGSYALSMLMLSKITVTTLLYIYCKANNHVEITEDFGKDYFSLPSHDGNFSQVVV